MDGGMDLGEEEKRSNAKKRRGIAHLVICGGENRLKKVGNVTKTGICGKLRWANGIGGAMRKNR